MLIVLMVTCYQACMVSRHLSKSAHLTNRDEPDVVIVEEARDLQRTNSNVSSSAKQFLTLNTTHLSEFYDKLPSQPVSPNNALTVEM